MSKIRTYDDLLQEEQRLMQQLKAHESVIRQDVAGMQEDFLPVWKFLSFTKKIFTRDNRVPLFNVALELAIDILLRRLILRKAGWVAKTIITYLVKNYSSHIIAEEKRKDLVAKVRNMFAKIRPKHTAHQKASI